MPRTAGKCGRRPPKRAAAIQLGRILTGTVPDHPAAADYLAAMGGGWQMLGNDTAGDCVSVTWANVRRLVSKTLGGTENYPSQADVWKIYQTQNPDFDPNGSSRNNGPGSQDDAGMDIQTLLEYLVKTGGPDGVKAVAFAQVDTTSPDEVKAAIALFGYVWTGINVLDVNMTQFSSGKPWDYSARSAVDGGHSVITGGYGAAGKGALGGDERFITWAEETSFTDKFWKNEAEEAWVVIWPEHLGSAEFQQGVDLDQLAADYNALTGKSLPIPAPTPDPGPAPDGPDTADQVLAEAQATWRAEKGL